MRAGEAFNGVPSPATGLSVSSAQFQLAGGKYWFAACGNFNSLNATLQRVGPDALTLITATTALSAAGGNVCDLPPGMYQVTISGSTAAIYWEVVRINEE